MKFFSTQKINYCFLTVLMLLLCFKGISQEKKEILSSDLWIKTPLASLNTNLKQEIDLKNYFNFNPVLNFSRDKFRKEYKSLVRKNFTLFVVFKCESKDENNLLSLDCGGIKTNVTTKKIQSDNEIVLSKGDQNKGELLTYLCYKNSILTRKKGSLTIDDLFFENRENKNQLMELIYLPRYLNKSEQNLIESYLSVKYGISLPAEEDYHDATNEIIWNSKENKNNSFRVTGIGRDDLHGLNQKQSGNSQKDGLYIGLNKIEKTNSENKSSFEKKQFLLWGDNNQSTEINENEDKVKKMKRVWKAQVTGSFQDSIATQVVLNSDEMKLGEKKRDVNTNDDFVWLAVDNTQSSEINFTGAHLYKATVKENNLIFDNVVWKTNTSSLFTFIKAPDFFVLNKIVPLNCELGLNGVAKITIAGGVAPYKIRLYSDSFSREFVTNKTYFEINQLAEGTYHLEVSDANSKIQKSSFTLDGFVDTPINLASQWVLEERDALLIKPTIRDASSIKKYEWFTNEGTLISSDEGLSVSQPGYYQLLVTNQNGCHKALTFEVKEKAKGALNGWMVYPNPVKANENFVVKMQFLKPEKTTITIYDENGRLLKTKDLGMVKEYEYKDSLSVSGTYLVSLNHNSEVQTCKVIIK